MKHLILASTSPYRRELLERLAVPFDAKAPLIDEEKEKDARLSPRELAEHLAHLKARSLASTDRVVIGGDQLVAFEGRILGKPHHRAGAIEQLTAMAGKTHELVTAVCLFDGDRVHRHTDVTRLTLKPLSREQIERIVDLDEPFDCAGSYKIEKHGIALVERIESADFTAIQGLPLLAVSKMLGECGLRNP